MNSFQCSARHKILTARHGYKSLLSLSEGDELMTVTLFPRNEQDEGARPTKVTAALPLKVVRTETRTPAVQRRLTFAGRHSLYVVGSDAWALPIPFVPRLFGHYTVRRTFLALPVPRRRKRRQAKEGGDGPNSIHPLDCNRLLCYVADSQGVIVDQLLQFVEVSLTSEARLRRMNNALQRVVVGVTTDRPLEHDEFVIIDTFLTKLPTMKESNHDEA